MASSLTLNLFKKGDGIVQTTNASGSESYSGKHNLKTHVRFVTPQQ